MNNGSHPISGSPAFILAVSISLILATMNSAIGQAVGAIPAKERGIENVLYLTVRVDPSSPLLTQNGTRPMTATMDVFLRISAHSKETNFFGIVKAAVPDFDLAKSSPEREVWRDGTCHHERGFPKITVTGVDGMVAGGQEIHSIAARWRQLGLFLPRDEVLASRRMDGGTDTIGPYIATRTETKQSRLLLDLKLYILPCELAVVPQRGGK
jgi:hypothetical protein